MSLKKQSPFGKEMYGTSISQRNLIEKSNQRARNPVSRSRMTVRGQFPSKKMQRMIGWESQLERRACYLFEFSSNILSFREQPIRFQIPYLDKIKRYTPDFEVISKAGNIAYCEVKPLKKVFELKDYFNSIDRYLSKREKQFFVLTEEELIKPKRELNLIFLRRYQTVEIPEETALFFEKIYSNNKFLPLSLLELENFLEVEIIYSAIGNGYLSCDLNNEITSNTLIFLTEHQGGVYESELFCYRTAPYF